MDKEHNLLLTRHIKPDYGFYIQGDDRLYVAAYSSVASLVVRFSGYFLGANGEVRQYAVDVAPTSDRAVTSAVQFFGEGFILSCSAHLLTGNANRGQCYVRARIQRGTGATLLPIAHLIGGYLTDEHSPSFPYGRIVGPLDGLGALRSITGSDPAAGAEISETVPTGARWRLHGIQARLVTSATVGDRNTGLAYDDGTTVFALATVDFNHAAGDTIDYSWGSGFVLSDGHAKPQHSAATLAAPLAAGYRIRTNTKNFEPGDNWAAPQLLVEEWIEA